MVGSVSRRQVRTRQRNAQNLAKLTKAGKARIAKVNEAAATDFEALVRRIIPLGDPADGNLVTTLKRARSERTETGFTVSIGGPEHPYPFALEVGHRARDGSHVAGRNYWFPARRTIQRQRRKQSIAALQAAAKEVAE